MAIRLSFVYRRDQSGPQEGSKAWFPFYSILLACFLALWCGLPSGARRRQEEPGGARRRQEEPRGARRRQEQPEALKLTDQSSLEGAPGVGGDPLEIVSASRPPAEAACDSEVWKHLGPAWGRLGPAWSHLGAILAHLEVILAHLEPSWGHLRPSWDYLGAILAHLGAFLGHLGGHLGEFRFYFRAQNASKTSPKMCLFQSKYWVSFWTAF